MDNLEKKVTGCVINHPDGKAGVLLESVNELQKQLSKFGRVVEDYKQNLDLIEHLQQMMEEVLIKPEIHSVALIWGLQREIKAYSSIVRLCAINPLGPISPYTAFVPGVLGGIRLTHPPLPLGPQHSPSVAAVPTNKLNLQLQFHTSYPGLLEHWICIK